MGENDKAAKILKTKEFAAFLIEIMNYLGSSFYIYIITLLELHVKKVIDRSLL